MTKLAAKGRQVEIDPGVAYECRMNGVGTSTLEHTREGLQALRARAIVALRELRSVVTELYPKPASYGARYCDSRIEKIDARIAADITKETTKTKEIV